jgi:N-methylhydantoinase A/oxoprolinase/acetone carboxylase beta subunit
MCDVGDPARVADLDADLVRAGVRHMQERLAELVDRVKTSADPLPVVVVGGGSILLEDHLEGASEILKPDHFAVANAIGAAIAQVGAEVDKVFSLAELPREQALDSARQEAIAKATAAGAQASTVQIVDVEEVPLAYLPSNAVRIRVKAVGDLPLGGEDVAARS